MEEHPDIAAHRRARADISRAFRSWLGERDTHLSLGIVLDHGGAQELTFLAGWPELEGSLTLTGLDIAAMRDGECWDLLLLSLDVDPVVISAAGVCSICDAEGRHERFETLEALWRDHLFEPLRVWIVQKLASASRLEFQRLDGGRWARLIRS